MTGANLLLWEPMSDCVGLKNCKKCSSLCSGAKVIYSCSKQQILPFVNWNHQTFGIFDSIFDWLTNCRSSNFMCCMYRSVVKAGKTFSVRQTQRHVQFCMWGRFLNSRCSATNDETTFEFFLFQLFFPSCHLTYRPTGVESGEYMYVIDVKLPSAVLILKSISPGDIIWRHFIFIRSAYNLIWRGSGGLGQPTLQPP